MLRRVGERAAHYVRVSTEEQRAGWSPDDQLRLLADESRRRGETVVEVVRLDEGYSGADPDRPGLKRLLELAEAGEVGVIRATRRDRLFRSRLHRLLMDRDLEELGVRLEALNDVGLQMGDGLLDEFAEFERQQITQRTLAGKAQKARAGKVVAGERPNVGFRYNDARDGYEVHEEAMSGVRRAFELVAGGMSLSATARTLAEEGFAWNRHLVRQIILDDVYRPHTRAEIDALMSEGLVFVPALEGCGIWWYNRTDTSKGRRKNKTRPKPRSEWIAVPVPASGVPRRVADAARSLVEGNERSPASTAAGREWELSGGILRCAGCGNAMNAVGSVSYRDLKDGRKRYEQYNYRCDTRRRGGECPHAKTISARKAERAVWEAVRAAMLHPERLESSLREAARKERPAEKRRETAAKLLVDLRKKRDGYVELAAEGFLSCAQLQEKLTPLDARIREAEAQTKPLPERPDPRIALRKMKVEAPEVLDSLSPEGRRRLYLDLDLRARFQPGMIEVEWFGLPLGDVRLNSEGDSRDGRENAPKIYARISLSEGSRSVWVA